MEFDMASTINTNMASLTAQRAMSSTQGSLKTSMERLSTGLRINSAKDDSAGLAIAERMTSQVRGMSVASRNANDAISMSQTADGSLGKIGESLQRMRELAVQARNDANSSSDKENLNQEYKALASEVDRVVKSTKFNGHNLLTNNASTLDTKFQVGAGTDTTDQVEVKFKTEVGAKIDANYSTVVTSGTIDSAQTEADIGDLINGIDSMIDDVTTARSYIGAQQNRFDGIVANLSIASENVSAARGRITDADFAVESANLSRSQVLSQAGSTMLAQANQQPQQVLSLLR
jgi:flagellin